MLLVIYYEGQRLPGKAYIPWLANAAVCIRIEPPTTRLLRWIAKS